MSDQAAMMPSRLLFVSPTSSLTNEERSSASMLALGFEYLGIT